MVAVQSAYRQSLEVGSIPIVSERQPHSWSEPRSLCGSECRQNDERLGPHNVQKCNRRDGCLGDTSTTHRSKSRSHERFSSMEGAKRCENQQGHIFARCQTSEHQMVSTGDDSGVSGLPHWPRQALLIRRTNFNWCCCRSGGLTCDRCASAVLSTRTLVVGLIPKEGLRRAMRRSMTR